jgi:hypothetical protein
VQQHILEQNRSAKLRVYVIWMPMLVTDARSEVDESLISDPRVRHFWDGDRAAGTFFAQTDLGGLGSSGLVWDAFYIFGPHADWDAEPAELGGSGSPVITSTGELEAGLKPLL